MTTNTEHFFNIAAWCLQIAKRPDDSARLYLLPTKTPGSYAAIVARAEAPHAMLAPLSAGDLHALIKEGFTEVRIKAMSSKVVESFADFPRADAVAQVLKRRKLELAAPTRLEDPSLESLVRRSTFF